jgi:Tol biopolymer transport system component/tRNA A-37 threonylcarbamoyl transferase component Bud32
VSIEAGQQLLHYRLVEQIGEGGMGVVWKAVDTDLGREVAIKILPAAFAAEPERLSRFEREARLLASLNHPGIAAVYGLHESDGTRFLAMELVQGEDLSVRLRRGKLPIDDALEIAGRIGEALEAAHDAGVIHRDLKPANVMLTPDGKVKVLDFGLAKALSADPDGSGDDISLTTSPTLTAVLGTRAATILGTAGYMSPEQARGKKVDRRADIWSFAVVLFEMLSGETMFTGETATDVIAQVVTREPDWDRLPPRTPVAVRRVLRRCLQKDPRKRLRDIGDAALELRGEYDDEDAAAAAGGVGAAATPASRRFAWLLGAAGVALGVLLTAFGLGLRGKPEEAPTTWTNLVPPAGAEVDYGRLIELSPNGRRVVFVATPPGGDARSLWVRDLDSEVALQLEGTEGADQPFWSPDSRSIGYFAKRKLRTISGDGGPSTSLADVGDTPRGGCWSPDGSILYGPDWSQPLYRVPATGGTPEAITELNEDRLELSHRWPHMLPDGKHFLFYAVSTYPALNPVNPSEVDKSGIYLGSLDGGEPRLLDPARSRAVYVDGKLFFVDDNVLRARPFDLKSLSFAGEAATLAENVTQSADALWGGALFSVSQTGNLLFVRGAKETRALTRIVWLDRQGETIETVAEVQPYNDLRLSGDDRELAVTIGDPSDVWIVDLVRHVTTRFTFDSGNDDSAIWSPDDDFVAFSSSRIIPGKQFTPGNLFRKDASGMSEEEHLPVQERNPALNPSDWSPDGAVLALTAFRPKTGGDILLYVLETGELEPWLASPDDEQRAVFSPDGRWVAYESDETGRNEIYVTAYAGTGGKWQLSSGGGEMPQWRADGRELFYTTPDDAMMAVPVETDEAFRPGTPVKLFDTPGVLQFGAASTWDVSSDGQRFIFLAPVDDRVGEYATVTLVQGWPALLD